MTVILAIDQGTSMTKALVVADGGEILALVEHPVHPVATPDGRVEQDPRELWTSVVTAGRQAVDDAGTSIDGVGLANQGETVLGWERRTGQPIGPALVWQDRRASTVCDRLSDAAAELTTISGLELDPYFAAPKAAWLKDHASFPTGTAITTTDTWLLHQLCGAYVTDAATASRWLTLDLATTDWSPRACEIFGLDPSSLPTVVDCAGPVGDTSVFCPDGRAVPVCGLVVDQQAALFAESCHAPGEAKCTYGTGAFLLATTGLSPTWSTNGLVGSVAWRLDGRATYCLDGQVFTVGSAVRWLTEVGVFDDVDDLDRLGATVSGPDGAVFVPGLAGLGAPFWKADARGAFCGLHLGHSRAHLARAVSEGIAAQVAWLAHAAAADLGSPGSRLDRLRVDGGLTRSAVLMQTQADLLGAPVECYPSPHATSIGVAAFARLGLDPSCTPSEAVGAWRPSRVFEPQVGPDETDARLDAWRRAAEATLGAE